MVEIITKNKVKTIVEKIMRQRFSDIERRLQRLESDKYRPKKR